MLEKGLIFCNLLARIIWKQSFREKKLERCILGKDLRKAEAGGGKGNARTLNREELLADHASATPGNCSSIE